MRDVHFVDEAKCPICDDKILKIATLGKHLRNDHPEKIQEATPHIDQFAIPDIEFSEELDIPEQHATSNQTNTLNFHGNINSYK